MCPEKSECWTKTSTVQVVWANFGILSGRPKWFPVAIVDHKWNLVISQWTERMQQSVEWRHSGSPRTKIFRAQKSSWKFVASIFWYQDCTFLIDYLQKSQINKTEYYLSLLVQFKNILKEKFGGNFIKIISYLHEIGPSHRTRTTQKKMAYQGFQCLNHTPNSTDLALLDCHLFSCLKKKMNVRLFVKSLVPRSSGWTDKFLNFLSDFHEIEQWAKKCIYLRAVLVYKSWVCSL